MTIKPENMLFDIQTLKSIISCEESIKMIELHACEKVIDIHVLALIRLKLYLINNLLYNARLFY